MPRIIVSAGFDFSVIDALLERAGVGETPPVPDLDHLLLDLGMDSSVFAAALAHTTSAGTSFPEAAAAADIDVAAALQDGILATLGPDALADGVRAASAFITFVKEHFEDITSGVDVSPDAFQAAVEFLNEPLSTSLHALEHVLVLAGHPMELLDWLGTADAAGAVDVAADFVPNALDVSGRVAAAAEGLLTLGKSLGASWLVAKAVRLALESLAESRRAGLEAAATELRPVNHLHALLDGAHHPIGDIEQALMAVGPHHRPF